MEVILIVGIVFALIFLVVLYLKNQYKFVEEIDEAMEETQKDEDTKKVV